MKLGNTNVAIAVTSTDVGRGEPCWVAEIALFSDTVARVGHGADTPSTATVQWIQSGMNIGQTITSIARWASVVIVVESWVEIADLRKPLP